MKTKLLTSGICMFFMVSVFHSASGRWPTIDRYAEKYPSVSPYSYAVGNPVNVVDINGDSIWFSYSYENKELSGVTMHFQGKVLNHSSSSVNMNRAITSISNQIQSTFAGNINGVAFNVDVNLGVAKSMEDVLSNDHLIVLMDDPYFGVNGFANMEGGMVAAVDADYFRGPWDVYSPLGNTGQRTAVHEIGHLLGLDHHDNPNNIMKQNVGNRWRIGATAATNQQRTTIHNNFINERLNKGGNFRISSTPSPSSPSGYTTIKVPNYGKFR